MITEDNLQKAKQTIKEFFDKTGLNVEVNVLSLNDKTIPVRIDTEDPKVLIGQNGQTLADIQHLLKVMLSHNMVDQFYIDLDINNYKEKKMTYIKESAREWADDVALTRKEKALDPMPSFERRLIHMELADRNDVKTESVGQGIDRYIVIRPC